MAVISMPVIATCLVFMASTCNAELVEISADEPELVGRVLTSLRLGAADLARLDADERAEMMDAMCAAEVTLGDRHRFRLRLGGARAPSQAHPLPHHLQPQGEGPAEFLGQLRRSQDTDKEEDASTVSGAAQGVQHCRLCSDSLTIEQCVQILFL